MNQIAIGEITVSDIQAGKTWRLVPPPEGFDLSLPLEVLGLVEETSQLDPDDRVVYSALGVLASGQVVPLLVLKVLGEYDYGGDMLEYVHGQWSQLRPDPLNPFTESFFANPHPDDPSFDASDHDERRRQREGFKRHSARLMP